jgi:lipid-binding SYLF domain-containing protein
MLCVAPLALAEEGGTSKYEKRRAEIDTVAADALATLFEKNADSKGLYDDAYGYAVFDNLKIAFGISGGGGSGVAVAKGNGSRTYMKMGTGGVGFGLGGQKYQVIFFFQNESTFTSFVEKGWQADASAKAAAGTSGANVKTGFRNGIAIYQLTDKGLMASADVAGTKYWKNKKLN